MARSDNVEILDLFPRPIRFADWLRYNQSSTPNQVFNNVDSISQLLSTNGSDSFINEITRLIGQDLSKSGFFYQVSFKANLD